MINRLLFALLLLPAVAFAQESFTLSGKVIDSETGEDLIGVTIYAVEAGIGTVTNTYGFYSLTLPKGEYTVQYSYMGYQTTEKPVDLSTKQLLNIEIAPANISLSEVVITTERRDKNITSAEMGVEKLSMKDIESIPVLFGEKDILKTIQLLPGISSTSEGGTGFNVRGGSSDENLILLDEAPVYSASHLMGFFSVFNSDALKDIKLYKGGIPSKYGGRGSSVLDITMKNGNSKKLSASGGIGLISTRLTVEAPIIKDRMSFIVSGRRTYADLMARALLSNNVPDDFKLYFYDLNAKTNLKINDNNRIFLSGYFGRDVFSFSENMGMDWGNSTGTLRWNHLFSDKLFSNTTLIYSQYIYGFNFNFGSYDAGFSSGIKDFNLIEDFTWYLNPNNTIKFGAGLAYHTFSPGEFKSKQDSSAYEIIMDEKHAYESHIYLLNEQKVTSNLSANYGVRLSMFNQVGPGWFYDYNNITEPSAPSDSTYCGSGEIAKSYYAFEPRLSLNYQLNGKSSVKLSYNRMAQYLHLLSTSSSGSPMDIWMPSSTNLKPLYVDQAAVGYFRNFLDNNIETSVEAYYKSMDNVADYKDGAEILFNEHVESQVLIGEGRSYGLEFYVKKKYGKFSGWISYTLSRTESKIETINNFEWYPVRYDKTHDVSIVGTYNLSDRITISGVWVYATGNAVTFPSGKYVVNETQIPYYTERNSYRMPNYHRLDLSMTLKGRRKPQQRYESSWDFSIYNVYHRKNAYSIDFRENEINPNQTEAVRFALFGIVPSFTYNFKF